MGQYVIIYNERNETSDYNPPGYSDTMVLELCHVEIYGIIQLISAQQTQEEFENIKVEIGSRKSKKTM